VQQQLDVDELLREERLFLVGKARLHLERAGGRIDGAVDRLQHPGQGLLYAERLARREHRHVWFHLIDFRLAIEHNQIGHYRAEEI